MIKQSTLNKNIKEHNKIALLPIEKKTKRKLTYTLIRPAEYEYNEELFIKEYSQFADLLLS